MSAGHTHPENVVRDGRIVGPWTCLRCGYGIAGLRPEDPCPECASPLDRSLDPRLLRYAPAEHLRRVRRGARGIGLSFIGAMLGAFFLGIYVTVVDALHSGGYIGRDLRHLLTGPLVPFGVLYAVMLWHAAAVFRFTGAPPDARFDHAEARTLRPVLRCFSLAPPLIGLVFVALSLSEWGAIPFDWPYDIFPEEALGFAFITALACATANVFGLALYAWAIGDRTRVRGRSLRAAAMTPVLFGLLTGVFALGVFALLGPMERSLDEFFWGIVQWVFVSSMIAGVVLGVATIATSVIAVDAARVALRRDEREATAAMRSAGPEGSRNPDPAPAEQPSPMTPEAAQ